MEEGICFSSYSLKLTTTFRLFLNPAIVLAREGIEMHLLSNGTNNEHFWPCVLANCHLEMLHNC
jgi:hypothetical protein